MSENFEKLSKNYGNLKGGWFMSSFILFKTRCGPKFCRCGVVHFLDYESSKIMNHPINSKRVGATDCNLPAEFEKQVLIEIVVFFF